MCTRSFQQHRLQYEQPAKGRMGFLSPCLQLIQPVSEMELHWFQKWLGGAKPTEKETQMLRLLKRSGFVELQKV